MQKAILTTQLSTLIVRLSRTKNSLINLQHVIDSPLNQESEKLLIQLNRLSIPLTKIEKRIKGDKSQELTSESTNLSFPSLSQNLDGSLLGKRSLNEFEVQPSSLRNKTDFNFRLFSSKLFISEKKNKKLKI